MLVYVFTSHNVSCNPEFLETAQLTLDPTIEKTKSETDLKLFEIIKPAAHMFPIPIFDE